MDLGEGGDDQGGDGRERAESGNNLIMACSAPCPSAIGKEHFSKEKA